MTPYAGVCFSSHEEEAPMKFSRTLFASLLAALSASVPSAAQTTLPAETPNAALHYWQAMADVQDPLSEGLTQSLVGQTEEGHQPWDEAKLGPILDANHGAIEEMQRGAKLPECNWGFDYNRGARASVSEVMRVRVLAKLNTLYGMRLMAKGQSQGALDAWLDGLKFARDIGSGGPVLLQLVGRAALLPDLQAMTDAAKAGKFSAQQKAQVASTVGALPPDAFDWGEAFGVEEASGEMFLNEIRTSKNPATAYRELMGVAMPRGFKCPSEAEIAGFRALIARAESELQIPPADAQVPLQDLQEQIEHSHRYLAMTVPSLTQINEARSQILVAREALLKALQS
jgi:hypothetical protein